VAARCYGILCAGRRGDVASKLGRAERHWWKQREIDKGCDHRIALARNGKETELLVTSRGRIPPAGGSFELFHEELIRGYRSDEQSKVRNSLLGVIFLFPCKHPENRNVCLGVPVRKHPNVCTRLNSRKTSSHSLKEADSPMAF